MGTRHLICIFYKGRIAVAQYGQTDGYPAGAGVQILSFLKSPQNITNLRKGLPFTKLSSERLYMGSASILDQIADYTATGCEVEVGDDLHFAHDTLFCEWAYVVDLDKECLEAYKGGSLYLYGGPGIAIGEGRLKEVGVDGLVLVARWAFGEKITGEDWVKMCHAPMKEAEDAMERADGAFARMRA